MAGIYLHIPFCKQACHYCDFHFSTSMRTKSQVIEAILLEISTRKSEFVDEKVSSIYFGGGTPSILEAQEIETLISEIYTHYDLEKEIEITLECNPDDLDRNKLIDYKKIGVNRLSIGIQSFVDEHLKFMNRAHSAKEALKSVQLAQDCGFDNLTIDLIYGIPGMSEEVWISNIQKALDLNVQHISSYCLTVEKGTALDHFVKKGKVVPELPEVEARQFEILRALLIENKFSPYEVSNYSKEGFISKHNSSYWKGRKYIGVGPSAHSFDGRKRRWNVSQNVKYMGALDSGIFQFEEEILTPQDQLNEYIMTGLRTIWGIDLSVIEKDYHHKFFEENRTQIEEWMNLELMERNGDVLKLTSLGFLQADRLASELFWIV